VQRKRVCHPLGPVTTRGKTPPADIEAAAAQFMATVAVQTIPPERVVTLADFVSTVFLPTVSQFKRPSTATAYRDIWKRHLESIVGGAWLRDVRTHTVQGRLNVLAARGLSRNTLKHIKSVVSAIFTLAKQQDYFSGENPARDTAISPKAPEPIETHAYDLGEIDEVLKALPEPEGTIFAVAAYAGLRRGEIAALDWADYRDGVLSVNHSTWNGIVSDPKTRKSRASVPVIRQLAVRLDMHRLRAGNPATGLIFPNTAGHLISLNNLEKRVIVPALQRAGLEWHGFHAARRGLGSNLYRLGVPDIVIQRILRHSNVNVTATYYIKTMADDVRGAMTVLENHLGTAAESSLGSVGTVTPLKTDTLTRV
jgi:integrase